MRRVFFTWNASIIHCHVVTAPTLSPLRLLNSVKTAPASGTDSFEYGLRDTVVENAVVITSSTTGMVLPSIL